MLLCSTVFLFSLILEDFLCIVFLNYFSVVLGFMTLEVDMKEVGVF